MSKHTPGPWKVKMHLGSNRDGSIVNQQEHGVALVWGRAGNEMFEANARLIAAAPEMLSELKACLITLHKARLSAKRQNAIMKIIAKVEGTDG